VPARLGWPGVLEALPESVTLPDYTDVVERAVQWQQYSRVAKLWEAGATAHRAEEGRAHALAGQMASVGEQIGLARAAAVEVALWRTTRDLRVEPDPLYEMSIRALAEAQSLFVYGAGHGLANVCVRAMALSLTLRPALSKELTDGRSSFPPYSNDRKDWVTLNENTARLLRAVAAQSGRTEVMYFAEPVAALGESDPWKRLIGRRGEDFHRWRPQTHGLAGVTKSTPWTREKPGTRRLSFGVSTDYVAAEHLSDETADIATAAMMSLADAMRALAEAWPRASAVLGGPRFRTA
jgi:hypothetical protein